MTPRREEGLKLPVVDFLDTSVLVEVLGVPGKSQQREKVLEEFARREKEQVRFILPTATIIETGNHVFQVGDGRARRVCAENYMTLLRDTAEGLTPWVLHERTWNREFLRSLCAGAGTGIGPAEHASRELLGTGDLSIVAERDLYASRARARVRIWTLEATMSAWADPGT